MRNDRTETSGGAPAMARTTPLGVHRTFGVLAVLGGLALGAGALGTVTLGAGTLGAGALGAGALGSVAKASGLGHARASENEPLRFTGTSNEGDVQEALEAAIASGAKALAKGGADHLLEYEVESIRGRHGGFAGFDQVTVTIRAAAPPKAARPKAEPGGNDR